MEGWTTEKLGEACDLIARGVAPKYLDDGGLCVLNQRCVRDHKIDYEFARRHDQAAKAVKADRLVQPGDVLVNSTGTGTLGRVAQVRHQPPEPTTVDTHVTIVRPKPDRFHPDFFGYVLIKIEDELAASGEGTSGQTELSRTAIAEKFEISYPRSIQEQKRIVAILDEAFEGIDKAIANTEKNLANARELFASALRAEFSRADDTWRELILGEKVRFIDYRGKTPPKTPEGIRLITAKNVKMGYINRDPEEFMERSAYADWMTRGFPNRGDVLFTTEAPLGNIAQLDTDEQVVIGQRLITMQPDQNVLTNEFLKFRLMSPQTQELIWSHATGATVQGIKAKLLKFIPIPTPSLEVQNRIAKKLDKLVEWTDQVEEQQLAKLAALTQLKASLLTQAFSGKLGPSALLAEAAE